MTWVCCMPGSSGVRCEPRSAHHHRAHIQTGPTTHIFSLKVHICRTTEGGGAKDVSPSHRGRLCVRRGGRDLGLTKQGCAVRIHSACKQCRRDLQGATSKEEGIRSNGARCTHTHTRKHTQLYIYTWVQVLIYMRVSAHGSTTSKCTHVSACA